MGNLNCMSIKKGDTVQNWIRRETKVGKKKGNIDRVVATVLKQDNGRSKKSEKQEYADYLSTKSRISTSGYDSNIGNDGYKETTHSAGNSDAYGKPTHAEPKISESEKTTSSVEDKDNELDSNTEVPKEHGEISTRCLIPRAKALPIKTFEDDESATPVKESSTIPCDITPEHLAEIDWMTSCFFLELLERGAKPQHRCIDILRNDPSLNRGEIRQIPNEEKYGSLEELKWSRHMCRVRIDAEIKTKIEKERELLRSYNSIEREVNASVSTSLAPASRYRKYESKEIKRKTTNSTPKKSVSKPVSQKSKTPKTNPATSNNKKPTDRRPTKIGPHNSLLKFNNISL